MINEIVTVTHNSIVYLGDSTAVDVHYNGELIKMLHLPLKVIQMVTMLYG